MALVTNQFNFFEHRGGMNTANKELQLGENEQSLLFNVLISKSGSLQKRTGFIKVGDLLESGSKVVGLDRYKTFAKSTLLAFTNQKVFYLGSINEIFLDQLKVLSITNPLGTTFRYNLTSSIDITNIEIGHYITIIGCVNAGNNGRFEISDITSTYVEITNIGGVVESIPVGSLYPSLVVHKTDYQIAIIKLAKRLISGTSYDALNGTAILTLDSNHSFLVNDYLSININSINYEGLVVEDIPALNQIKVSGIYEDFTSFITGNEIVYGSRNGVEEEEDWDSDGINEKVWKYPVYLSTGIDDEDTLKIKNYSRWFRCTKVASGYVYLDEKLFLTHGKALAIRTKWEQFTKVSGKASRDNMFNVTEDLSYVHSVTLNDNLYTFDGKNETFRYDGVGIFRAGFHEIPAIVTDPQAVPFFGRTNLAQNTKYRWKNSYQYTDSNGRIYESGVTPMSSQTLVGTNTDLGAITGCSSTGYFDVTNSINKVKIGDLLVITSSISGDGQYTIKEKEGAKKRLWVKEIITGNWANGVGQTYASTEMIIPVNDIPEGKNDNLGYDLTGILSNMYRTLDDGTIYFLSQQVSLARLGNYLIEETSVNTSLSALNIDDIAISGNTTSITFSGSPDLSKVQPGAYIFISGATNPVNNKYFVIQEIYDTLNTIVLYNAQGGIAEGAGASGNIKLMDITLANTPDLSGLELGDYLIIKGNTQRFNNGVFVTCFVDSATYKITVSNPRPTTDANADGRLVVCIFDNQLDSILDSSSELYTNNGIEENNASIPIAKYSTTFDNKLWIANGRSYQYFILQIFNCSDIVDGDIFTLCDGTNTEIYEFRSTGYAAGSNIKVDISKATNVAEIAIALSETINSKVDGICYAYYENLTKVGAILFKERQRNGITLSIKLNVANVLNYKVNDGFVSNDVFYSFRITLKQSRTWYSKDGEPEAFVGPFDEVQGGFYLDISPDDGQEITGIIPLKQNLIVFKEDSCYRVSNVGVNSYVTERIDPNVGCIAPKSICSIGNSLVFLSRDGVYATDGYYVNYIGERVRKYFENIPKEYMKEACAVNYISNKEYRLAIPYTSEQTTNNYALVYNYNYDAWYIFDNIKATYFVKLENDIYFSTYKGLVYKFRDFGIVQDYRDDFDSISAILHTRWYDLGVPSKRKMLSNLILHLYQLGVTSSSTISYAYDFGEDFKELTVSRLGISPWGYFPWGHSIWGYTKSIPVKLSPNPQKNLYSRFEFKNEIKDEVLEILGWTIEAKLLTSKAINQEEAA